jgi:hypothetical protein
MRIAEFNNAKREFKPFSLWVVDQSIGFGYGVSIHRTEEL